MTFYSNTSTTWASSIRWQVFQLILLLMALVTFEAGFKYWSDQSVKEIQSRANNYHLTGNAHYLRAKEDLRKIQNHHAFRIARNNDMAKHELDKMLLINDDDHSILQQLVHQEISKGLMLEREYADTRFTMLASKVEQQMASLSSKFLDYEDNKVSDEELISEVDLLLTAMEQLVRLHAISRDTILVSLHNNEYRKNIIFYAFIVLLLIFGILVSLRGYKAINRAIKEQLDAQKIIELQAHFDNLTGLPNRFLAMDRLSLMIKDAQRTQKKIAVLFLDLDHFKRVNDTLGHLNGDKLLIETAKRLSNSIRGGDTVGRLGGDEFIVLLGGISNAFEVQPVANDLISALSKVFNIAGKELLLTASVGISIYPDDGHNELDLIRKADSAMYHSKESGRNTYSYFTESMNRNLARQLSLEEQMRGALDRSEFKVFYQQKVDIKNKRIIGAEALLRWNNPALGMVSPDEFIPVAEQTGMIERLGRFVLAEALKMTQQWQNGLMPDFSIAVNLSPRQFRDPNLVSSVSKYLDEFNILSQYLELEITEGVVMDEYRETGHTLTKMNRIGIKIAMDDFGTGYSSLNNIRKYPFDVIKIDRSFIQDIDSNSMSQKLTKASISMAHSLDIAVVGEGVETLAQLNCLTRLGCDVVQGFYFGKPVPAEEMTALLESGMLGNESNSAPALASSSIGKRVAR